MRRYELRDLCGCVGQTRSKIKRVLLLAAAVRWTRGSNERGSLEKRQEDTIGKKGGKGLACSDGGMSG